MTRLLSEEEVIQTIEERYKEIGCTSIAIVNMRVLTSVLRKQAKLTGEELIKEIEKHTYKIRCLPFQSTKIRFIRVPEPLWQSIKGGKDEPRS